MRTKRLALPTAALLTAALALGGCSAPSADTGEGKEGEATVVRVIDGDTIVAKLGSAEETVRLLNLDTPETKDPDEPVECFGPEATEKLGSLLSAGDKVTLKYDQERKDKYGRTLAGVFKNEKLINAEMAREGLGVSMLVEPNRRFYEEVRTAEAEARKAGRGLFGQDAKDKQAPDGMSCSLAALASTTQDEVKEALAATAEDSSSATAAVVTTAAAILAVRKALKVAENTKDVSRRLLRQLDGGKTVKALKGNLNKLEAKKSGLEKQEKTFLAAEKKQRERAEAAEKAAEAKRQAAKAEAERKAAAKAAAQRAEAKRQAAAKAAAKAEAQRRAERQQAAPKPKRKSSGSSSGSSGSGAYPGYTGPRCYAPGGKSWKPCG